MNPVAIILHYTASRNLASATQWLCDKRAKASAHIIIGKPDAAGRVVVNQLVPFNLVAWHAGESQWATPAGELLAGFNRYAIGIELDNMGPLLKHGPASAPVYRSPTLGVEVSAEEVYHGPHKNGGAWTHWEKYPEAQVERAVSICIELVKSYPSVKYILGHDDVSPGRKWDCGPALNMDDIRARVTTA